MSLVNHNQIIKRLNLGITAMYEIEDLEGSQGDSFLKDTQRIKTITVRLINDIIEAFGYTRGALSTKHLTNSNLYLRAANKNLSGITASGDKLQEQVANMKNNLIKGFASYVLFSMAFTTDQLNDISETTSTNLDSEANNEIQELLTEIRELDEDLQVTSRFEGLDFNEERGISVWTEEDEREARGISKDNEDWDPSDIDGTEENGGALDTEGVLKWDFQNNIDLDSFIEKRNDNK